MGWEYYQTVDPLEKEPRVRRGLFGVRLLILHFKFQFFKSIKSSNFLIFLNLTYSSRKNISFTKYPKILQKFTQNRKTLVNVPSGGVWHCLNKGYVERRANSLRMKSPLNIISQSFVVDHKKDLKD